MGVDVSKSFLNIGVYPTRIIKWKDSKSIRNPSEEQQVLGRRGWTLDPPDPTGPEEEVGGDLKGVLSFIELGYR